MNVSHWLTVSVVAFLTALGVNVGMFALGLASGLGTGPVAFFGVVVAALVVALLLTVLVTGMLEQKFGDYAVPNLVTGTVVAFVGYILATNNVQGATAVGLWAVLAALVGAVLSLMTAPAATVSAQPSRPR